MEASETFGGGVDSPPDDPFAGSDFGDFGTEDEGGTLAGTEDPPVAQPESAPKPDLPVVNAEGERVDAAPANPPSAPSDGAPTAQPAAPPPPQEPASPQDNAPPPPSPGVASPATPIEATQPAPTPVETPAPVPAAVPAAAPVAEAPADAPVAPPGQPAVDPEQQAEHEEYQRQQHAVAAEAPAGATQDAPPASAPEATPPGAEPTEVPIEEAAVPEEKKDKKGRVTHRRYIILSVIGTGEYKQVSWYEDKDGKMVPRGSGAKRQKVALARDGEGALAIGFAAVGSPERGAPLIAVAESLFQEKTVQPDEPEPAKRKLKIS